MTVNKESHAVSIADSSANNLEHVKIGTCENCHQPVNGAFCSHCGQSVESTLKYFWTVILHLLDDFFSFDSRANRTLFPLLFKPGFLTREYFSGRRVHYVPPLRLYLFVSIIFFISLKFFADSDHSGIIQQTSNQELISKVQSYIDNLQSSPENAEKQEQVALFESRLQDLTAKNMFLLRELTEELIILDLKKNNEAKELSEREQKKYEILEQNISLLKAGKPLTKHYSNITFGNQPDGSFKLDFLSEPANEKLTFYAKDVEQKIRKHLRAEPFKLIGMALDKLPQLMFILLPIFACLLKIFYLFSNRLYLEHLTVALHSHSFIFLTVLLIQLLNFVSGYYANIPWVIDKTSFLMTTLLIWLPLYLFIMQLKVYRQHFILTTIKFGVIGICYVIILALTSVAAFVWGVSSS